ncbi:Protein N-acetyltransferase, RimJ/RimL family [Streptoalloteichus tenebrarius]|uniref:Protein N-acetyltransferase, RimJ/RimL family n=1 Tax=Streptoalloteichus tenebrarius (strain ATCC 17920 / DSM 40477 / JCM 4838 / CBS 697.72 / NBRC 16177 / NCIMB 11028 / NRRL B-12390 / A12253. 1 / ISP 5477) TaxID=1933 RepID=A0ABT1HYK9_STRSD|nr:GNAT family protein [Streptoalloteichus tenebrarius]MCP2260450.1 Protein N-acetyltransferase, RimJ/RimL family [Streptoalloteichus tenebrarius]BFF02754.1 GNAT family N-acetyltransferase [Streptoalloteichus tenebrarius]
MEPVEINAGTWYLRGLRVDRAFDDRPALVAAFADADHRRHVTDDAVEDLDSAGAYVARRAEEWERDSRCSWAVADTVSGEMLGEVGLKDLDLARGTAELACWTRPEHRGRGIMTTAALAALRFGFAGLGLRRVAFRHSADNRAAHRLAEKCGFTVDDRLPGAAVVDGGRQDVLVWSRQASTPES